MSSDAVEIAAAKLALGLVHSEELIQLAAAALASGLDTQSLRLLAGLGSFESDEAIPLFEKALVELEVETPCKGDAVMTLAVYKAARISSGGLDAAIGAKQISDLTLLVPEEEFSRLDPFVYAASEWDDRPEDRDAFLTGILSAADALSSTRLGSKNDLEDA